MTARWTKSCLQNSCMKRLVTHRLERLQLWQVLVQKDPAALAYYLSTVAGNTNQLAKSTSCADNEKYIIKMQK